jgi:ATPase subunit of ABC transporter with duplicated ATPase domains
MDYGELRVYPGNYDDYMVAASEVKARLLAGNAKKKTQIVELQAFVRRFSANASKAKQATSRAKQLEKIKLDEVKPSSRVNPFIRFDETKKLHRLAVELEDISKGYGAEPLFKKLNLMIGAGERVAVIGANGIGKSTLLKTLVGELAPDTGLVKWAENAEVGYFGQDHAADFAEDMTLVEWMTQWRKESDDDQAIRATLGRLLFSQDEINKSIKVLSGGEKGRMLFGKLMLQKQNVLILDEPTNHLDMESIESLNTALEHYPGTLIFVSHDREFVSSLATHVIEIKADRIIDFNGNYEDYLESQAK